MNETQKRGWTRREFMIAGGTVAAAAAFPVTGCGRSKTSETSEAGAALTGPAAVAARGTPWAAMDSSLELTDMLHLAEMNYYGEFMDFGTAARFKYTLGGWMTGWNNDMVTNGVAYTWATRSPSRLYFGLEEATDLEMVFRVKKGGTDRFSVYLNDQPLSRVTITGDEFETHHVRATAEQTRPGDNRVNLIYKTSEKRLGDDPASFAVDYIRIIPAETATPARFEPPHMAQMVQQYETGKRDCRSLMLPFASRLSYHFTVTRGDAFCSFAAPVMGADGKAPPSDLRISVTSAREKTPRELVSRTLTDGDWSEIMADLSDFAGEVVRLDIEVGGAAAGRLALGFPTIRTQVESRLPDQKKKNVIVLCIDTLRADKLQTYGNRRMKTAGTDAFEKEATVFENCMANGNWTKPSCATLVTGLHPETHKTRGHASRLGKSLKMVSEMFQERGYNTGAFIANGYLATEFGFNRGWKTYVNYIRERKNTDAENVFKDSLAFIRESGNKPFFTYIQTIDPHVPYDPPEEDLKIYDARPYEGPVRPRSTGQLLEDFKRKRVQLNTRDRQRLEALYDGEVTYHDRQFSAFVDELAKAGILDDTVVVVTSDHGEEFFEHGSLGHGHSLFEEMLHVPMIVRAPGLYPSGKRIDTKVALSDVVPTVLEATGVTTTAFIEGRGLAREANSDRRDPLDATFASFFSEADDRNLQWTGRMGDWKIRMRGPVNTHLTYIKEDPTEQVEVAADYPIAVRALRNVLGQFIGAPDKSQWTTGMIASDVVGRIQTSEEKQEAIPDDLKQQLRELGYMI